MGDQEDWSVPNNYARYLKLITHRQGAFGRHGMWKKSERALKTGEISHKNLHFQLSQKHWEAWQCWASVPVRRQSQFLGGAAHLTGMLTGLPQSPPTPFAHPPLQHWSGRRMAICYHVGTTVFIRVQKHSSISWSLLRMTRGLRLFQNRKKKCVRGSPLN